MKRNNTEVKGSTSCSRLAWRRLGWHWWQWLLLALGVAGLVGLAVAIVHYSSKQIEQSRIRQRDQDLGLIYDEISEQQRRDYRVNGEDKPQLLTIPAIGVDKARIQEIGLLEPIADGSQQMDVPKNVHDVGWYNCQINPVATNRCASYVSPATSSSDRSSVIDGHSCEGRGCVFDKLNQLQPGDRIDIQLGSGQTVIYLVDKVDTVDLDDVDMVRVMTPYQAGHPGLALITCDGTWSDRDSRGVRSMNRRVIVYATLKSN